MTQTKPPSEATPARPALVRSGRWLAVTSLLLGAAYRATHRWGATLDEHLDALPGDELVANPAIVSTRAVTIDAPVEEVWSWLVQIGQDRGGMYSYDALENLLGLDIHSTREKRNEWQELAVGDRIVLVPAGWAGMKAGYTLSVAIVDPPHTLVLRQSPPEHPWDAVWSFHIKELPDGRSRLLSRSRSHRHTGTRGVTDVALDAVMDPVTWLMTRKMLLGIKERAEAATQHHTSAPTKDTTLGGADRALQERLDYQVAGLRQLDLPNGANPVSEADLEALPPPAQRYLQWMGVLGHPRVRSFRTRFVGEIRLRPDQAWMPYRAWQYNQSDPVTRLVQMRIGVAGVVPMLGTDSYMNHVGRMHGKLLGAITVADGTGLEFDLGELVTYVNDAVMLAPSMLLSSNARWHEVDEDAFDITFTDAGNIVTARCFIDGAGRLVDFHTDDRWYAGTTPPTRTRWSTPVGGWTSLDDGRPFPTSGSAIWHFQDEEFVYARGSFDMFKTDPWDVKWRQN
jgi:hypothetical protein